MLLSISLLEIFLLVSSVLCVTIEITDSDLRYLTELDAEYVQFSVAFRNLNSSHIDVLASQIRLFRNTLRSLGGSITIDNYSEKNFTLFPELRSIGGDVIFINNLYLDNVTFLENEHLNVSGSVKGYNNTQFCNLTYTSPFEKFVMKKFPGNKFKICDTHQGGYIFPADSLEGIHKNAVHFTGTVGCKTVVPRPYLINDSYAMKGLNMLKRIKSVGGLYLNSCTYFLDNIATLLPNLRSVENNVTICNNDNLTDRSEQELERRIEKWYLAANYMLKVNVFGNKHICFSSANSQLWKTSRDDICSESYGKLTLNYHVYRDVDISNASQITAKITHLHGTLSCINVDRTHFTKEEIQFFDYLRLVKEIRFVNCGPLQNLRETFKKVIFEAVEKSTIENCKNFDDLPNLQLLKNLAYTPNEKQCFTENEIKPITDKKGFVIQRPYCNPNGCPGGVIKKSKVHFEKVMKEPEDSCDVLNGEVVFEHEIPQWKNLKNIRKIEGNLIFHSIRDFDSRKIFDQLENLREIHLVKRENYTNYPKFDCAISFLDTDFMDFIFPKLANITCASEYCICFENSRIAEKSIGQTLAWPVLRNHVTKIAHFPMNEQIVTCHYNRLPIYVQSCAVFVAVVGINILYINFYFFYEENVERKAALEVIYEREESKGSNDIVRRRRRGERSEKKKSANPNFNEKIASEDEKKKKL